MGQLQELLLRRATEGLGGCVTPALSPHGVMQCPALMGVKDISVALGLTWAPGPSLPGAVPGPDMVRASAAP